MGSVATGGGRRGGGWIGTMALAAVVLSGCDREPAEILGELNAAREGCTEEKLKAGDEECVRMFEAYAEMGADAMETYIGALRALDEAVERRGGLSFDTAGLGRVFSEGTLSGYSDTLEFPPVRRSLPPPSTMEEDRRTIERPGWAAEPESWPEASGDGRWNDLPRESDGSWEDPRPSLDPDRPRPAENESRAGATNRRGALLPPAQRLNRPWIGDEVDDDPYLEGGRPTADDPRRRRPETALPAPAADPYPGSTGGRWD